MGLKEFVHRIQQFHRHLLNPRHRAAVSEQDLAQMDSAQHRATCRDGSAVSPMAGSHKPDQITVAVVYATRSRQRVEEIQVNTGATIQDGILISSILEHFPEIDLAACKVGIHGMIKPSSQVLRGGDRIEIYRPASLPKT